MLKPRLTMVVPLALSLAACNDGGGGAGGPIDATTNAQRTSAYAGDIFRQVGGGLKFVTAGDSVAMKMFGASGGGRPAPTPAMPDPLPRPLLELFQQSPGVKRLRPVPIVRLATMEEDFDDTANDLEAFLRDRLLADANIETRTETEVTYRLKPDPTCRALPSQQDPGAPAALDADCAADLAKLEVRVVATKHGDGGRFQVLLGPQRHELSVIIIHSDEIAWQVGLASAKKASDYADAALGKVMAGTTFETLAGRLQVSLKKLGEDHVAFTTSVLETVEVDAAGADAAFRLAKSDPLFRVAADGVNRTATLELGVGQVDVKTSWDPRNTGAKNRDLHVAIGGLHGKTTLSEAQRQIAFDGLGVGATSVMVRGTKIFGLDFNPADGRKVDLVARLLAGDVRRFEVKPRFDLSLMFRLAAVAGDFTEAPEAAFADETYSIALGGASPAAIEILRSSDGFDDGVKVAAGKLTISAKTAPAQSITVEAGQCLVGREMPPEGAHPVVGSWQAGACM